MARTEAVMAQCSELKALVLSRLEADDEPEEKLRENAFEDAVPEDLPEDLSEAEAVTPAPVTPAPVSPVLDTQALDTPAPVAPTPEIPIVDVDLPEPIEIQDSVIPIFEKASYSKSDAVVDKLASKEAWRTDLPGTKVSDIRSAISLNDRILFINHLFGEDPAAFKEALTSLNAMENFDQAADYIASIHPEWNMESDTVYRFMMAVRRRLQ